MRFFPSRQSFFFLTGLLILVPLPAVADFELINALHEFGEKRFVATGPSNITLGPIRFHPTLRNRVEYDSNVFLEDKDEKQDIIFRVTPGAIVEIPFDRHQLVVGYEADMEFFTKSRHRRQNNQNQDFFALLDLNFPSWYINVLERFSETSGRAGTTFTERIPRFEQSVHPKIGVRWNRLVFEGGFRHFMRNFRRSVDKSLDFQVFDWTGVLYYDLFARLKALLEYQYSRLDYRMDVGRDSHINQVRLGLEGEVRPNVSVRLRSGMQFRNYDLSARPNYNSWVSELRVEYDMRENLSFHLAMRREPVEATFRDVNFYLKHAASVGAEYFFLPRWAVFGRAVYARHNYRERATVGDQTVFRRDHLWVYRTGLRYIPRAWWEMELAYEHARRTSNLSTFDYIDNRFSVSSAIRY